MNDLRCSDFNNENDYPKKEQLNNIEYMKEFIKNKKCQNFIEEIELDKFISAGSAGSIYRAKANKFQNKYIALKFYLNEKNNKDSIDEIEILRKLKHKNIVESFGYFNNIKCNVLEFITYGDLNVFQNHFIKRSFSHSFLCYIAKDVLEALKYCHKCKIVHLDIKEGNILINGDLNIKLTDFSVSYYYGKYDNNEKIVLPRTGTKFYMSPEIINKEKIYIYECNKIDIFSLGVFLYESAYGIFPFGLRVEDKNDYNIIYSKIQKEKLVFPSNQLFSKLFEDFISHLLEKNIQKRFSIEEALGHPWIKGADIIYDEKEKLDNINAFIFNLEIDNIYNYEKYIKDNETETNKMNQY